MISHLCFSIVVPQVSNHQTLYLYTLPCVLYRYRDVIYFYVLNIKYIKSHHNDLSLIIIL
jgi:hypothetical protein